MDRILISVLIPNYNYAQYLEQCLQSVLDSDFDPAKMEIIVMDDASTDNSVKVIDEMMKISRFPFRLIKNETNQGLILSRNRGIANAHGEFLFFLDSDNYIRKDCIKTHVAVMQENPEAIACYAPIQNFLDKTGEHFGLRSNQPFDYNQLLQRPYIDAMAMFRKKELIKAGMYDIKMPPYGWEDYELWLRLGKLDKQVIFIEGEPLSFYRTHPMNMSKNYKPDQYNHLVYYLRQNYPVKLIVKKTETLESFINYKKHIAQLYYQTEDACFNEQNSVKVEITENPFHFNLPAENTYTALRFDPVNDYAVVKLNSIRFNHGEVEICCNHKITSNAGEVENTTYYFAHSDPQITIEFDVPLQIDEVVIDVTYLKTGTEMIEELGSLNKLKAEKMAHLTQTNQTLNAQLSEKSKEMKKKAKEMNQKIQSSQNEIDRLNNQNAALSNELAAIKRSHDDKTGKLLSLIHPLQLAQRLKEKLRLPKNLRLIKESGLFDEEYYLENNADVKNSGVDAARHYLIYGGFEGRNPSNNFDSRFYLYQYPDVEENEMNPLVHYLKFGRAECRLIQPVNYQRIHRNSESNIFGMADQSMIKSVFSENLNYPTTFSIFVVSNGEIDKLNITLNSLLQQSYQHWHCFILDCTAKVNSAVSNELDKKADEFLPQKFSTITGAENLFALLESKNGFIGFLEEGEFLMPDCLWHFYDELDENTELMYSDHDIFSENSHHSHPWFTFNWSHELLLSQNYTKGFYVASVKLFLKTYQTQKSKLEFLQKIDTSPAWRYGVLLNIGNKASAISRIPEVLWSYPLHSDEKLNIEYLAECDEIQSFLSNQGLNAKIEKYLDGKIRHVKWALDSEPEISIIIPTTGNLQYLKTCLDTLLGITAYRNFEVIILDNGRGKFPDGIDYARTQGLKVIEVNEDFNWAKLNNIGVRQAKGELLLFLNDDIEITDPMWLAEMVRLAVRKDVGVVGSLLLYPNKAIQHAGVFLVDHGGGARHLFYKQKPGDGIYHHLDQCVREVSANTGACMMVNRKIFDEIGGFDENLALVGNDIDFCLRCLEAGYRNLWTPFSKLIHHESITRKAAPIEKDEKAMWERWGKLFRKGDYYYNPNLTLEKEDCSVNPTSKYFSTWHNHDIFAGRQTKLHNQSQPVKVVSQPPQQSFSGVNLISYIRAEMGIGEAARGNAKALKAAKIPFGVVNFEKGNPSKMGDLSLQHREMQKAVYDINILQINADQTPFVVNELGNEFFNNKYTIGFWAWELPEFPDKWTNAFDLVDEIWVPSSFVAKAVSIKSPVPVITIPHVISTVKTKDVKALTNRDYFNIPENAFVFLSMFDVYSQIERKNPFGSILAFKKAFKADDSSVLLIIKVNNSNKNTMADLNESIGDYKNIHIITKHLTRQEIEWLLCSIDCFVSLHRSEGFGLVPAEAMARGKIAMLTNWSGNTEYMTTDNCIPISFKLTQIGQDLGPYEKHQYWAEPDLNEASFKMKSIISNPGLVKQIGERARFAIAEHFSAEKIGSLMKNRIEEICRFK